GSRGVRALDRSAEELKVAPRSADIFRRTQSHIFEHVDTSAVHVVDFAFLQGAAALRIPILIVFHGTSPFMLGQVIRNSVYLYSLGCCDYHHKRCEWTSHLFLRISAPRNGRIGLQKTRQLSYIAATEKRSAVRLCQLEGPVSRAQAPARDRRPDRTGRHDR